MVLKLQHGGAALDVPGSHSLRLNAALDLTRYAEIYRERGMVQIPAVFDEPSAAAL